MVYDLSLIPYFLQLKVYRFLSSDCKVFLPSYDCINVMHLRDLADGKRTPIKCTDVKVIQLPYYEGLTIEDILEYAAAA